MKETIAKWGSLIFMGFIFMGVMLHARGFSESVGTIDTGVNQIGRTLEGR